MVVFFFAVVVRVNARNAKRERMTNWDNFDPKDAQADVSSVVLPIVYDRLPQSNGCREGSNVEGSIRSMKD